MTNKTGIVVKSGTCVFCMNNDLPLSFRGDELMCNECTTYFDEQEAMNNHNQDESQKYSEQEAAEWLPEDGYGDEDDD